MDKLQLFRCKTIFHINMSLFPMKLVFFFTFGGFAGILPYITLIAKNLGITSTAVGLGYSVIPFFIFISNPIIGLLVDYFQNIKVFLIVLVISSAAAHSSILSLSPIHYPTEDSVFHARVFLPNDSEPLTNISTPFDVTCMDGILQRDIQCELRLDNEVTFNDTTASVFNIIYHANQSDVTNKELQDRLDFTIEDFSLPKTREYVIQLKSLRCSPNIHHCATSSVTSSVFETYQYWTFFTLIIFGGMTWISCMTLCCVACCEILGPQMELYGRQRLFGTISTGVITALAGILNDNLTTAGESFLPGLYLMAVFLTIAVIIMCIIHIPKIHVSTNICKDVGKIFSSKEIVVFSSGVALIGFLATIISMYEFWFLEDMGANQTLLGLSVALQCLLGEVPFLFFSGWFVKKFGYFLCLVISFGGFVIRFLLYSILNDPWLVLPIDLLHGLTYGVYHGAMASFAKLKAPKGMEATLLGFYGGLYDGLGHGIGSFVGGFGLDKFGAKRTFFMSSMISMRCLLSFLIASYVFRESGGKKECKISSMEMKE